MVGKHESVEKLLADLEQRNAAAREAGAGQDMTVDVVVGPCEVAQTIHDMVTKSRPRSLIAPTPTLPTISPPRPPPEEEEVQEEEEEEEEEVGQVHGPEPEPEAAAPPPPVAERPPKPAPVPQAAPAQTRGPTSPLQRAEGSGKEIMLQVRMCTQNSAHCALYQN